MRKERVLDTCQNILQPVLRAPTWSHLQVLPHSAPQVLPVTEAVPDFWPTPTPVLALTESSRIAPRSSLFLLKPESTLDVETQLTGAQQSSSQCLFAQNFPLSTSDTQFLTIAAHCLYCALCSSRALFATANAQCSSQALLANSLPKCSTHASHQIRLTRAPHTLPPGASLTPHVSSHGPHLSHSLGTAQVLGCQEPSTHLHS